MPYHKSNDKNIRLYNADCWRVLTSLSDGSVHTAITDIPYGAVNRASGGLRNLDKSDADVVTVHHEKIACELARISTGSVYVWCGTEQVSGIRRQLVLSGMSTRMCGWEKTNPSPMNGDKLWLSSFECCVFGRHPKAWFDAPHESPIWKGPTQKKQVHPTQKPLWLMDKLVKSSVPPGESVIDPFMGSGTTGLSCARLGRQFIGVEKNPEYFKIAKKRLDGVCPQAELFAPQGADGNESL